MPTALALLSLPTCLLLGGPTAAADKPGSIAGVVRYTGEVPPPQKVVTSDGRVIDHRDLVVEPKGKGLRDVVAVLEDAPAQPKVTNARPAYIDQREMVYLPRVVAVRHGQAVSFDNNDSCNHSVLASSTLPANQFNVFVASGKPYEHVFAPQKHPVQIGCSLHAWMRAWVYVVPHPWFAVSDARGNFEIKDVPPGKHTLWLRHPDTGHQEHREVEVQAGKTLELTVEWNKVGKK